MPTCQDCSPGAVIAGRFVTSETGPQPVIANRLGTVVRVLDDRVAWLGPAFTTEATLAISDDLVNIALDDAGGAAIATGTYVDVQEMKDYTWSDAAVIGLGPDHVQRWRTELGNVRGASLAASPAIIAVVTDAKQINGVTISTSPIGSSLVALSASDGRVLWHIQQPYVGAMAFSPDGTLIIGATFTDTLDLGGTTMPLTTTGIDGVVASLDPTTGAGKWALELDGMGSMTDELGSVAVGPGGEVAASWTTDFDAVPASVMLIDATGVVKWTQPATRGEVYAPIVTDGEHVWTSGGGFAQFSASGMDWRRSIAGPGQHVGQVLAFDGSRLFGSIYSAPTGIGDPPVTTTVGDVTYDGDGIAVVELAH
ncbi:MAG TPA: PQQ-binding-like beta-propeller repeat protein [Kofleriaceae bacterium]|nr:PQQ-binding-like beta-propeller repeat protein [Kofleriaceae bacterium]